MSSEVEFLDVIYLGVFIILSPAFDRRFYDRKNLPPCLSEELSHAKAHFLSILHRFSNRFIILLEGDAVAHAYVLDRMLAEFAAASVNMAKETVGEAGKEEGKISASTIVGSIEDILRDSHPEAFHYYSRCLSGLHKHFIWTGPQIQIIARSEDTISIIHYTSLDESLDFPHHQIYPINVNPTPPSSPISSPTLLPQLGKRRERSDGIPADQTAKKRRR